MKWVTRVEISNGDDVLVAGDGANEQHELESLQVDLKEKNSTFSFTIRSLSNNLINRFPPRKTMVKIFQGLENDIYHLITGFIDSPPIRYSNKVYQYDFSGVDYTVKMQDILVNEAYENKSINYIVNDLLDKYLPEFARNIETCDIVISIKFKNKYLYDCMEQLANVVGWNFKIDKDLVFQFWNPQTRINPNVLTIKNCKPTFDFKQDISKLVTRLRVEGATRLSDDQTTVFYGDGENKVFQIPRRNIRVSSSGSIQLFLNGQPVNLGIKNIDNCSEDIHFLYDSSNYTIESDQPLASGDILKVIYRYEYPVLFIIEDLDAQAEYGIIDRLYKPNATDEEGIKQEANNYLAKYKKPIYSGSIEPLFGYYEPGELVRITLPKLKIDDYLKITSVQYSGTRVQNIKLNIEETLTDADLLKSLIQRIRELEENNKQDGPVETINNINDALGLIDTINTYRKDFDRCGVVLAGSLTRKQQNIYEILDISDIAVFYSNDLPRTGDLYAGGLKMNRLYSSFTDMIDIEDNVKLYLKNFVRCGTVYISEVMYA